MNFLKYTIILFLIFLPLISPSTLLAFELIEDFSSTNINPNWSLNENGGSISFTEFPGFITLRSSSNSFPYIFYPEMNLSSNFQVDIAFRYIPSPLYFGTGIVLSNLNPISNVEKTVFGIWQDQNLNMRISTNVCSFDDPNCGPISFYSTEDPDTQYHIVTIQYLDNQYNVLVDGNNYFISEQTDFTPNKLWFGNPTNLSSSGLWSEFQIDYIHITDLSDNRLDVPLQNQNDPDWSNDVYDHAGDWNSDYPNMDDLGCAVSSASMQLNYYGVDQLPDGTTITPQSLNSYLTDLNGGYLGKGLVNWLKISSMSKEANVLYGSPKLEWHNITGVATTDTLSYENHIDSEIPEILKLDNYWLDGASHFFVGTGYDEDNFLINDPLGTYDSISRTENVKRRGYFAETNSDFSGMTFVSSDSIHMLLINPDGQSVGFNGETDVFEASGSSYLVEQLPFNSSDLDESLPVNTELMLTHIIPGEYRLVVTADEETDFSIDPYIQNVDGSAIHFELLSNSVSEDEEIVYIIHFNNDGTNSISEHHEPVTFEHIRQFINDEYDQGNMNKWFKNHMLLKLKIAEFMYEHGRERVTKITLDYMTSKHDNLKNNRVLQETRYELNQLIEELISQLGL